MSGKYTKKKKKNFRQSIILNICLCYSDGRLLASDGIAILSLFADKGNVLL